MRLFYSFLIKMICISIKSTSKVNELIQKSGLPRNEVYKMICLPAIAKREGCALLQPAPVPVPTSTDGVTNNNNQDDKVENINVKSLLNALGGCVECANDEIMNTMMVTTAMMGPMYGVMRNNQDWLGENICYIEYNKQVNVLLFSNGLFILT